MIELRVNITVKRKLMAILLFILLFQNCSWISLKHDNPIDPLYETNPEETYISNVDEISYNENIKCVTVKDFPNELLTSKISFTIDVWIYPFSGVNEDSTIISNQEPDNGISIYNRGTILSQTHNETTVYSESGGGGGVGSGIVLDSWNHIVLAFKFGILYFYNGSELISISDHPISIGKSVNPLLIGAGIDFEDRSNVVVNSFSGYIKDVAIWNYERSDAEIAAYNSTILNGDEEGLIAYWKLDEGSGQTAVDSSAGGHNGFLGSEPDEDINDPEWILLTVPPENTERWVLKFN